MPLSPDTIWYSKLQFATWLSQNSHHSHTTTTPISSLGKPYLHFSLLFTFHLTYHPPLVPILFTPLPWRETKQLIPTLHHHPHQPTSSISNSTTTTVKMPLLDDCEVSKVGTASTILQHQHTCERRTVAPTIVLNDCRWWFSWWYSQTKLRYNPLGFCTHISAMPIVTHSTHWVRRAYALQ